MRGFASLLGGDGGGEKAAPRFAARRCGQAGPSARDWPGRKNNVSPAAGPPIPLIITEYYFDCLGEAAGSLLYEQRYLTYLTYLDAHAGSGFSCLLQPTSAGGRAAKVWLAAVVCSELHFWPSSELGSAAPLSGPSIAAPNAPPVCILLADGLLACDGGGPARAPARAVPARCGRPAVLARYRPSSPHGRAVWEPSRRLKPERISRARKPRLVTFSAAAPSAVRPSGLLLGAASCLGQRRAPDTASCGAKHASLLSRGALPSGRLQRWLPAFSSAPGCRECGGWKPTTWHLEGGRSTPSFRAT